MNALLVDDNRDFRAIIAIALSRLGFRVQQAATGLQGLNRALEKPAPELIVLDHNLPELTGADVARKVRERGLRAPIILISGDQDVSTVARKAGIQFWLRKPFKLRELEDLIDKAIGISGRKPQ